MNETIDSINRSSLVTTRAGGWDSDEDDYDGYDDEGKAGEIRWWIARTRTLGRIIHYKAEHQRIIDGAATALQLALPRDIVVISVLPFLHRELPSYLTLCTPELDFTKF